MADVKISGLPASTVPLAGTEVLPIVQGGATKQVSIANVTAGRAIAATSITTDTYKAASSSGGALQNSGGTPQLQWGAGGGNNLSVDVAININPANAAVAISPTGTGTVAISPAGALTINPTAASTINNTSVGATTASTGRFTTVNATTSISINGKQAVNGPSFSAYGSVAQTVSNTTYTALIADTEEFDLGGCYNNTGSTVTLNGLSVPAYSFCPNVEGYYQVSFGLAPVATVSLSRYIMLVYKNGANFKFLQDANSTGNRSNGSCFLYLNGTGDYITAYGWLNGTGTLSFGGNSSADDYFQAAFVRGA
jgi:hypothetical protein